MKLLEIFCPKVNNYLYVKNALGEEHMITVARRSILSANKEIDEKERTQKRAII